jgi:hypothetical protein
MKKIMIYFNGRSFGPEQLTGTLFLQQPLVFALKIRLCAKETPTVDGNPALFPHDPVSADFASCFLFPPGIYTIRIYFFPK